MKKVLIISFSPLHRDVRILRQINALLYNYEITTIGNTPVDNDLVTHHYIYGKNPGEADKFPKKKRTILEKIFRRIKGYLRYIFNTTGFYKEKLNNNFKFDYYAVTTPDVIIANDWDGLYLASGLKHNNNWKAKIYFDAHEYSPTEYNHSLMWRLLYKPLITTGLKHCKNDISVMTTVCDGIAFEYEHFFKFPKETIRIVNNAASFYLSLKPCEMDKGKIKLIHHGNAQKERRIELMIQMMEYLDPNKFELTLMLVKNSEKYYDNLINKANKIKNIKIVPPVPFSEIITTLNKFDIGVYILKPDSFNHKHALPNKLFEFIQARLAIAIAPSVEMVKIVDKYNLGVHSNDYNPKSLAAKISQLTPEKIMEYKYNSDKYALELSDKKNIDTIRDIVRELTEDKQ